MEVRAAPGRGSQRDAMHGGCLICVRLLCDGYVFFLSLCDICTVRYPYCNYLHASMHAGASVDLDARAFELPSAVFYNRRDATRPGWLSPHAHLHSA